MCVSSVCMVCVPFQQDNGRGKTKIYRIPPLIITQLNTYSIVYVVTTHIKESFYSYILFYNYFMLIYPTAEPRKGLFCPLEIQQPPPSCSVVRVEC